MRATNLSRYYPRRPRAYADAILTALYYFLPGILLLGCAAWGVRWYGVDQARFAQATIIKLEAERDALAYFALSTINNSNGGFTINTHADSIDALYQQAKGLYAAVSTDRENSKKLLQ